MDSVIALAQAVVADAGRKKVIWAVFVFAALLALAVPSLPSYGGEVIAAVYREVTVALMLVMALVVGLSFAATRIPAEVERRTVFTVLARDVRRWQYVAATWIGMFVVTGLVLAAFSAVAIVVGRVVYDELMLVLLQAALAVWLETGVVIALTLLLSTRFGAVTAVVGALAFLFVGHSISGLVGGMPWVPSLDAFNVVSPVAHGSGLSLAYIASMIGVFVAWTALLLVAASVSFAGRDL